MSEDMTMSHAAAILVGLAEVEGLLSGKICLKTSTGLLWTVKIDAQALSDSDLMDGNN